jgi:hypothetical protein
MIYNRTGLSFRNDTEGHVYFDALATANKRQNLGAALLQATPVTDSFKDALPVLDGWMVDFNPR